MIHSGCNLLGSAEGRVPTASPQSAVVRDRRQTVGTRRRRTGRASSHPARRPLRSRLLRVGGQPTAGPSRDDIVTTSPAGQHERGRRGRDLSLPLCQPGAALSTSCIESWPWASVGSERGATVVLLLEIQAPSLAMWSGVGPGLPGAPEVERSLPSGRRVLRPIAAISRGSQRRGLRMPDEVLGDAIAREEGGTRDDRRRRRPSTRWGGLPPLAAARPELLLHPLPRPSWSG